MSAERNKNKYMNKVLHQLRVPLAITIAIFGVVVLAGSTTVRAYTASQYTTTKTWATGTVIALDDNGKLLAASLATKNYIGVVTNQTDNQVEIARSGIVSLLVSDRNGAVKDGTPVALSDVAGVGAAWSAGRIQVGVARGLPVNGQTMTIGSTSVKVASVEVQLTDAGKGAAATSSSGLGGLLQQVASGVVGHAVDTWRVVAALILGLSGLVLSFGLLLVSSRESFFSLGRNPSAGGAIMKGLWRMAGVAIVVMCLSLGGAFLVMKVGG
jgi:hypothetical protein